MKAIIDCNSFYCSCERVFRPDIDDKPVVVLSNNDGCMISLSKEAKALGLDMATPYFQAKEMIKQHGVEVFSSNYNLYGDMSRRIMQTLQHLLGEEKVEVYSVDEAFLNMDGFAPDKLYEVSTQIKQTVEMWTGVKVSIGVAKTKTLAKLANRLCKKETVNYTGVMVLADDKATEAAMRQTNVKDIWGIGFQYSRKLKEQWNIHTAWDLHKMPEEWARKNMGGVVGQRLLKELRGEEAIMMDDPLTNKKMIATTRMFGHAVTELKDIKEAVAAYASRTAEKLRRQNSVAGAIKVFVVPKENVESEYFKHGNSVSALAVLPFATSATHDLIKPALMLAEQLFNKVQQAMKENNITAKFKKAGVIVSSIVPDTSVQANLFHESKLNNNKLMQAMDNINFSMRDDVLKYAASGTKRNWKMQQNFHSPKYTTRWKELCMIK